MDAILKLTNNFFFEKLLKKSVFVANSKKTGPKI